MTPETVGAGWLIAGIGLLVGAWFALLWLKSRFAEARHQGAVRDAEDLARAESWFACLHQQDVDDLVFGVDISRDMDQALALAAHTNHAVDRLASVTQFPQQRNGDAS